MSQTENPDATSLATVFHRLSGELAIISRQIALVENAVSGQHKPAVPPHAFSTVEYQYLDSIQQSLLALQGIMARLADQCPSLWQICMNDVTQGLGLAALAARLNALTPDDPQAAAHSFDVAFF